jgi:hypothetical protein
LFAPGGRELCWAADFVGSIQLMQAFFYKIAMPALVGKIGTMNPASTDRLAPLQTD